MDLELLKIYTLSSDGRSCSAFPSDSSQIELVDYQYVSSRMGTTVVTAAVRWPVCLDSAWTGREFVVMDESAGGGVLGKEKFFLLHRPGSEKGSDDERYVHTLEFQSERDVVLNSVYFLDAVSGSADRYVSNSWSVKFFGTLGEFVGRYTAVLSRMGLGGRFSIVIDSGVASTEVKEVSFEKATLFEVLQKSYEVWGVPFYFVGNVIHFGEGSVVVPQVVFEYGAGEELLGVQKTNVGAKLVTRCSGYGSSENIPCYYPNPTPKGTLKAGYNGVWSTESGSLLSIVNQRRFSSGLDLADTITYVGKGASGKAVNVSFSGYSSSSAQGSQSASLQGVTVFTSGYGWSYFARASFGLNGGYRGRVTVDLGLAVSSADAGVTNLRLLDGRGSVIGSRAAADVAKYGWAIGVDKVRMTVANPNDPSDKVTMDVPFSVEWADVYATEVSGDQPVRSTAATQYWQERTAKSVTVDVAEALDVVFAGLSSYLTTGNVTIEILPKFSTVRDWWVVESGRTTTKASFAVTLSASASWTPGGWRYGTKSDCVDDLSEVGLSYSGTPALNDVISQGVVSRIPPSEHLMPSVYRTSGGAERFCNALNNTYPIPGGSPAEYYTFPNPYDARSPREHVEEFPDIMPTVRNLADGQGNPLNVFDAVFFEEGFNAEETDAEGNLKYNWFFARLKPLGFSLFDSASESGEMSFSMLDGHCAGCRFKVVADKLGRNPVAVKQDGTLDVDAATKRVRMLDEPQAGQQDSTSSKIWIALYLDAETFGGTEVEMGVLPNSAVKPSANDSYAILNIDLPDAYILAAEQRLQEEVVRFMWENNDDKYSYTIRFSRVWLAQNPEVRAALNAHCSLNLRYNGVTLAAPLHVSQYTYRATEGESLPEISVELSDIIESPSSGLEQKIAAQVDDVVNVVRGAGGLKMEEADARYVRKDVDDTVETVPTFAKGLKVGPDSGMAVNASGESVLDVDWLNVRRRAVFSQVEIDRLRQVGGRLLVTLASMRCSAVEEISSNNVVTSYRCFFQPVGDGGEALKNGFAAGDLAICQSFGNGSTRYWWRRVLETGADYIVVSNASGQYDAGSDVPAVGDEIVQLGNVSDASRQAAQVLSCTGADSPSLVVYVGVNGFSLSGRDIYGIKYANVSGNTYQPYFFNYGSMLLGDRAKADDYVEYDHANGLMTIKANVVFKASQTLSGITEFGSLATAVGALQTDIAGWPTVKAALNGATAISGGLVLTSMIQLGQRVNDVFTVKSGINGVYDSSKAGGGVAGWYGGNMWDLEHLGSGQTAAGAAKSLFRFDGSGYVANGGISWSADGATINLSRSVTIGGTATDTLDAVLTTLARINNMFELDTTSVSGKTFIKAKHDGLYTVGQLAAGGVGGGGGGGGTQVSWGTAIGSVQPLKVANDERNLILARSGVSGLLKADGTVTTDYQREITSDNKLDYSLISDTPSSLKNPYALTFGSKTYDGSAAKTITASDLGAITSHQTVTLASGTNNGTLKLTVNGAATDNIAVKGLGTAAYKDESGTWAIGISGNAATATKFASAQSVALTGDITGSASSQAGWSIATTIGTGKVTNAMLAGSIANGKLANSSMTIAGTSVSLGGSITAATIGNALTSSAPAACATTATNLNGGWCKVEVNTTDWNFSATQHRITALKCTDAATIGSPGIYHYGYSFISSRGGFQLVTTGNTGTIYKIRKVNDNNSWTDWVSLYNNGNCNLTTVDWSAKSLTLAGAITGATTGSFSGAVTADSLNITGSVADREYPAMVDSSSAYNIMLKANNVVGLMFDGQNCVIRRSGTVISLGSNSYRWGNYYGSACNINGALTLSGTSAATAKIEFSRTDSTNYILFPSSGAFAICRGTAANSSSAIYVGSDSNVGVGTYSPQYKLSLQGGVADFLNDNNSQDIHTKTTTAATFRIHYQNTADTMVRIALLARNNQGYYIGGGENGFAVSQQYYGAFNDRIFLKGGNGSDCGNVGIGNTAPTEKLHVTGNILATGQVTAGTASDIRLKTNVSPLKDADSILASLRPVEFDWNALATSLCKSNAGHDTGLIAQEVEEVMPQAVSPIWGDYKRVDYAKLTPVLVSGWQSHETQIQALKRKIYELEERLRNYGI